MPNLFETREVEFSRCRHYRYRLRQIWNKDLPLMVFCMLNPSKADEAGNDPTVERCERRARATKGCGGVEIVNIFAYRSTDPEAMKQHPEPIGQDNDRHILEAASTAMMVVCGWGNHGQHLGRGQQVLDMLVKAGVEVHCLKINSDGFPAHPLYIGYGVAPKVFQKERNNK